MINTGKCNASEFREKKESRAKKLRNISTIITKMEVLVKKKYNFFSMPLVFDDELRIVRCHKNC